LLGARVETACLAAAAAPLAIDHAGPHERGNPQVSTTGPCRAALPHVHARDNATCEPLPAFPLCFRPLSTHRHHHHLPRTYGQRATSLSQLLEISARSRPLPACPHPISPSSRPPLPRAAGCWRLACIAGAWRAGHGRRRIRSLTGCRRGAPSHEMSSPRARQPVGGVAWRLPSRDLPCESLEVQIDRQR
jgi:hypothetical protein